MAIVKRSSKLTAVLLIVSVFFTACEIPDISKFTEQSAEMTRGVRKGVKDTENVIKAASVREDFYSAEMRTKLKRQLKEYQGAVKPTGEALDALDTYLEALNALAQANKKSEENSRAVVNSVKNLVTVVSGFTFATPAVNIATGLLNLEEQFRATRDFRKQVNLAAAIVEGVHPRMVNGKQAKDDTGRPIFDRKCKGDAGEQIVTKGASVSGLVEQRSKDLTDAQKKELAPLSREQRREKLAEWGKLSAADVDFIERTEKEIAGYGCGVIDFIKFNVRDVRAIHDAIADAMVADARDKHRVIIGFYDSITANDRRIQNELEMILNYKSLVALIRQTEASGGSAATIGEYKTTLREHLDDIFSVDGPLKVSALARLEGCGGGCRGMKEYLDFSLTEATREQFLTLIRDLPKDRFDMGNGHIEAAMEERAAVLYELNTKYLADLERITPAHSAASSEIKSMIERQNQLDALLESSMSALDAWAETHANLRVTVNTKKPLTVSKLASKVRELWGIINAESE